MKFEEVVHILMSEQRQAMKKWHPIEEANNLLFDSSVPVDINSKLGQARLKDLAWRCIEELAEAMDENPGSKPMGVELIDCLHFIVEFCISSLGLEFKDDMIKVLNDRFAHPTKSMSDSVIKFVHMMGRACNHLKNRAWKPERPEVDLESFKLQVLEAWLNFWHIIYHSDCFKNCDEVIEVFRDKAKINEQRIKDMEGENGNSRI